MKNIFLIETKYDSSLFKTEESVLLYNHSIEKINCKSQFIYITNEEDIQNGDYVIVVGNPEWKTKVWKRVYLEYYTLDGQPCIYDEGSKFLKVCLTNNPELIEDGIQAVDSLFLSSYAENQPDYVEVTKSFADGTAYGYNFIDYKLDFPQEKNKTEEKLYTKKDLEIAFNQGCAYTIGSHELFKQTH